ncbi:hypothetical protein Gotri_003823, partial [Gossypium trilobum]|nr:hypothetical protein [Gossypium trilobum]
MEIWQNINMSWVTSYRDQNIRTWLTWVFAKGTKEQCQVFCCALWVLWSSQNQMVHEKKLVSVRDLVQKIRTYLAELEGVGKEKRTLKTVRIQRQRKEKTKDTIQFNAAFDANRYRSASGIIVRDRRGEIIVLKTTLHSNTSSSFLAEASACLQAIKLGTFMGLRSVTIMGDSKTVIKKCQTTDMDKSIIGPVIRDIQSYSSRFQEIIFQFIQ